MPLPDYETLMLPLLRRLGNGAVRKFEDLVQELAAEFRLTPDELAHLLPSGRQTTFRNRIGWARTYMSKAGLVDSVQRGQYRITPEGQRVLGEKPAHIDDKFLRRYPAFVQFQDKPREESGKSATPPAKESKQTPEDRMESAHAELRRALASELLERIGKAAPDFFERLVVELLLKMGYGGSRHDAGRAIGRSGDGGIDGIINEDRLGLDSIYLQAKRWDGPVGRPEIQKFAGALAEHRARKGVFITTSSFTKEALASATKHDARIVLIDGEKLATLTIDHGLGVTLEASYEVKRIDSDYFAEE